MMNLGSFPKWLFHDGTKFKLEESESEATRDLLPKASEVQRQRDYGKLAGNIGCTLIGLVFFTLFTIVYVALTAKLSSHLWMPNFEYREVGGKNLLRRDHSGRSSGQVGDGLPSTTKDELELPVLSTHETEFNLRAKRPKDESHPPVRMFIYPKVHLKTVRSHKAMRLSDERQQFLGARTREHFPEEEDLVEPVQKLDHERPRRSASQVAEGSMSAPRRPNRRIPVLHHDRLSRGYNILRPTDAFDDHDNVHR